jgi:hypothetical protein
MSQAAIIYVNHSAVGINNGTSWTNAFTTLSAALQAASSGDEIWVAAGVYKPTVQVDVNAGGPDTREVTFQIPDGVLVYGGFAGTEILRDERNWQTNLTVLSGDIDNNDVNLDGNFVAETSADVVGNNAYHVVYTSNVGIDTRLDGFVITAGRAAFAGDILDPNQDGGAWYNRLSGVANASSPTIANTTFQGNFAASEGGAMYNTNAPTGGAVLSTIENCEFISNKSDVAGGAIALGSFQLGNYQLHIINSEFISNEAYRRGGAIHFTGDHARLDSVIFKNNRVTVIWPGETRPGSGGAVSMTSSNAAFNQCIFDGNSATGNPTGPYEGGGGGAIYMSTNEPQSTTLGISAPSFVGCGFYNNVASGNTTAWGGAAVHLSDAGKLKPSYVNCVFSNNEAQVDGGAIANFARVISLNDEAFVAELTPTFINCTFSINHAGARGGALYNDGYVHMGSEILRSRIENSILWNNSASVEGPQVHNTGTNVVAYSLIQGSGGSGSWNAAIGTNGGDNIDEDPEFINEADADGADNIPANGDDGLRLNLTSPAINAGNNAAVGLSGVTIDYAKLSRLQGANVDMGAYERFSFFIPDLNYWLWNWRPFDPTCLSCPWSFLLLDRTLESFVWDGPAQFVQQGETAYIKGHIVNPKNNKIGFDVYLKLVNKQDWKTWSAKRRTYTALSVEAALVAKKTHTQWLFWELSPESYLRGTGTVEGELALAHAPSNLKIGFQLGTGANAWDKDLGMSGSFSYRGRLKRNGKWISLKGVGSMNVDATLCEKDCLPFEESASFVENELYADNEESSDEISVYPNPANDRFAIATEGLASGKYSIKFYDHTGALRKVASFDTEDGSFDFSVAEFDPGIYVLKLVASSGETRMKKLIVE